MKNASFIGIIVVTVFAGLCGCTDLGSDVPQPASVSDNHCNPARLGFCR